jgi:ribosome-binding protein aMBF1 (putative translation factor)
MAYKSVSEQIRDAIEHSGMSRYAICKAIEMDQGAMSRFMSGERGLSLEMVDKIGELLGLRIVARKSKPKSKKG